MTEKKKKKILVERLNNDEGVEDLNLSKEDLESFENDRAWLKEARKKNPNIVVELPSDF